MTQVEAARFLGVAPWDLESVPEKWLARAVALMNAKGEAREIRRSQGAGHPGADDDDPMEPWGGD